MSNHEQHINIFLSEIFHNILKLEEAYINVNGKGTRSVSITEAHIIEKIGTEGGRRMSDVAADLRVTLPTLTLAADRLERKELIVRERDPIDRRATNISLTKKGVAAYHVHERFHKHMIASILEGLTEEDEEVLEKFLLNLNSFFSDTLARELRKSE